MKHYDENTLELYALGDAEILKQKEEIERHLAECFSCAELYSNIAELYVKLEGSDQIEVNGQKMISTSAVSIKPAFSSNYRNETAIPKTFVEKSIFYIRRKPVKSTISAAAAIFIFILGFNFKNIFYDNTADMMVSLDKGRKIEIRNKSNNPIFTFNSTFNQNVDSLEAEFNIKFSVLTDINNDGKKEFITVLPDQDERLYSKTVKVFSSNGVLLFKKKIGSESVFKQQKFDDNFTLRGLVVDDFNYDGKKEIIVGAFNRNSPYLVAKLKWDGTLIGEYWHYGHFWGISKVIFNGKTGIFLCGINDSSDNNESLPAISFIDPNHITGQTQSEHTPFFNNKKIIKEIAYRTFPVTKYSANIPAKPRITTLLSTDGKSFLKVLYALSPEKGFADITLNSDLIITGIQPYDSFTKFFGKIDQTTLNLFLINR